MKPEHHLASKCNGEFTWFKVIKRRLRAWRCELLHRPNWVANDGRGSQRLSGKLDQVVCTQCSRTFEKRYA